MHFFLVISYIIFKGVAEKVLRVSDLRMKDIVNIVDGKRLGMLKDIELNLQDGKIKSIILPGNGKVLGIFGRGDDVVISWEQIKKIGVDVILVEAHGFTDIKHELRKNGNLRDDEI